MYLSYAASRERHHDYSSIHDTKERRSHSIERHHGSSGRHEEREQWRHRSPDEKRRRHCHQDQRPEGSYRSSSRHKHSSRSSRSRSWSRERDRLSSQEPDWQNQRSGGHDSRQRHLSEERHWHERGRERERHYRRDEEEGRARYRSRSHERRFYGRMEGGGGGRGRSPDEWRHDRYHQQHGHSGGGGRSRYAEALEAGLDDTADLRPYERHDSRRGQPPVPPSSSLHIRVRPVLVRLAGSRAQMRPCTCPWPARDFWHHLTAAGISIASVSAHAPGLARGH